MDLKEVETLISLAKDNGLAELSYKNKEGTEIKVKMVNGSHHFVPSMPPQNVHSEHKAAVVETSSDPSIKEVTSPFVGTFYRATSPDAEPYAKQNQKVSSGQVLCIVEAMKIMNEIESDFAGEIVEICVENETYVEFGQVLFKIRV